MDIYLTEASHFMYDDNYVIETKVKIDGKTFPSKKAAESNLKGRGLTRKQIDDKLKRALKIADTEYETAYAKHKAMEAKHSKLGKKLEASQKKLYKSVDNYNEIKNKLKNKSSTDNDKLKQALKIADAEYNTVFGKHKAMEAKHSKLGKKLEASQKNLYKSIDNYNEIKNSLAIDDEEDDKDYHRNAWQSDEEDEEDYENDRRRV